MINRYMIICQDMNQIWLALLTGLTTGGVSCLAVQGGFLASSLDEKQKTKGILMFLGAKIIAYTILGGILGLIGSAFVFSSQLLGLMQIAAGLFMIVTAARLANIHPIFRYFVITPPKFALKAMRLKSKSENLFAPGLLGFMTVLIPCGITQAMMLLAISTGSVLFGAAIMFAFTLGTSPIFLTLGIAIIELLKKKWFTLVAALAIFILGVMSVNSGQIIRGSVHNLQNYWKVAFEQKTAGENNSVAKIDSDGKQLVKITVKSAGYVSDTKTIKAGIPVKLTLVANNVQSCARSFLIPSLGISKIVPETGTVTLEFTPTKTGILSYSCGMGMYTGQFTVVE